MFNVTKPKIFKLQEMKGRQRTTDLNFLLQSVYQRLLWADTRIKWRKMKDKSILYSHIQKTSSVIEKSLSVFIS